MIEELVLQIRKKALSVSHSIVLPDTVNETVISEIETMLGFSIPEIMSQCYRVIGNGGFGPGYGLIGLPGGAGSDYGDIVETYHQLRSDQEEMDGNWPSEMLPFVDYRSNIFACVDCESEEHYISIFEDFELWEQEYTLDEFFEMWVKDIDALDYDTE